MDTPENKEKFQEGKAERNSTLLTGAEGEENGRARPAAVPGAVPGQVEGNKKIGFLDLIYGVLFNPSRTFSRIVDRPPLGSVFLIYTLVNGASLLMGILTFSGFTMESTVSLSGQVLDAVRGMVPAFAFAALIFQYLKWLFYSPVLHLLAEFFGGTGGAKSVFAVYGLAGLPGLLLIPVQLLVFLIGPQRPPATILMTIFGLGVLIWSIILLSIGIREAHGFSTGRAAAVVFAPAAIFAAVLIIFFLVIVATAASIVPVIDQMPAY